MTLRNWGYPCLSRFDGALAQPAGRDANVDPKHKQPPDQLEWLLVIPTLKAKGLAVQTLAIVVDVAGLRVQRCVLGSGLLDRRRQKRRNRRRRHGNLGRGLDELTAALVFLFHGQNPYYKTAPSP